MANIMFKRGLLANLPSAFTEGTFYITTDERAIYLDVNGSTRIRLGDFQEFDTLTALQAHPNPSATALYYVDDLNCLAKWNGTEYVQINPDTGMTSIEVTGDGNAVTAAIYDAASRKLVLTKGASYMSANDVDNKISTATGDMTGFANVKAYIDKKTEGIASDTALEAITGRVTAAEEDIGTLQADAHTHENKAVIDSITADKVTAWDAAEKNAKEYADTKVDSVNAGDASISVGGTEAAPTVAAKISQDADNALSLSADGLKVAIPSASEYSIAKDETSGDYAAVYRLTKDGANIGTAINIPKDMVVESGSVVTDPVGQSAGTYIELKLQNVEAPLYINVGSLIEYVTSGSKTGDMIFVAVSDDHKVTASITDGSVTLSKLHTDIQTAIGKAHTHDNADVLAGINATKAAAWDAAESNAKTYADGLADNYDAIGSANTAETNAKAYTDSKITEALAWGSF